jgi:hypothetical protein
MSRFAPLPTLALLTLAACADTVDEQRVPEGTFVLSNLSEGELDEAMPVAGSVTLVIDRAALTLTVQLEDGSEQVADLVLRDKAEWEADCYTMNSHALTEVYDVDVESLDLGGYELDLPVLTAKCGGRPLLGADGGEETFAGPIFVFDAVE